MTRLERTEKYAVIAASIAAVAGILFGGWQVYELVKQNDHEERSKSAELTLQLAERIEEKYGDIEDEIDNNNQNHSLDTKDFPAPKVERYINQLDDVGVLFEDELILPDMAYNDFSYDAEKAWCNIDIKKIISHERGISVEQLEKIAGKEGDFHWNFEILAKHFLDEDQFPCADVDKE